jgi:MoaA/NifB/PqqE/SkfB family radical SAM enzyme
MEPKPHFDLYIDVFGFCNLRCPSCPVANVGASEFTKGLMSSALLGAILEKANRECQVGDVGLYNWTEPLLNPVLPDLVVTAKRFGNRVLLSSNLNKLTNADAVMEARPDFFRVSISGFSQAVYERAHRGGNIETVKKNMQTLALSHQRFGSRGTIQLLYHRYRYNRHEEEAARAFSEGLGFEFTTVWAMLMPAEKILSYLGDKHSEPVTITARDREVIESLSVDLLEALSIAKSRAVKSCHLQERQIVLDVNGDVFLCCGTTSAARNRIGNFLDLDIATIQELKTEKSICNACIGNGIHQYFVYQGDFSDIARVS